MCHLNKDYYCDYYYFLIIFSKYRATLFIRYLGLDKYCRQSLSSLGLKVLCPSAKGYVLFHETLSCLDLYAASLYQVCDQSVCFFPSAFQQVCVHFAALFLIPGFLSIFVSVSIFLFIYFESPTIPSLSFLWSQISLRYPKLPTSFAKKA